jgi:hypothetical protein
MSIAPAQFQNETIRKSGIGDPPGPLGHRSGYLDKIRLSKNFLYFIQISFLTLKSMSY